jgi:SAM-dependent methyltransferase
LTESVTPISQPGPGRSEDPADRAAGARSAIERNRVWYHTLELAPGVLTPGQIDLRETAAKLLPDDLSGKRALDVGTFDGFWAFELERRGAEVVAIDVQRIEQAQWPPNNRVRLERESREFGVRLGIGFELAAEVLGSKVSRVVCDVLDLTPEAIGGKVDVAFLGALLVHLRDPVAALERIFDTLEPGGELYQLEPVSLRLSLIHPRRPVAHLQTLATPFNWWYPNRATLRAWLGTAGFVEIRKSGLHKPTQRKPMDDWFLAINSRRPA